MRPSSAPSSRRCLDAGFSASRAGWSPPGLSIRDLARPRRPTRWRVTSRAMPEGDTIHRAAERLSPRACAAARSSGPGGARPALTLWGRAVEIEGRVLEAVEARGSTCSPTSQAVSGAPQPPRDERALACLADARVPRGKPWLTLASGRVNESRSGWWEDPPARQRVAPSQRPGSHAARPPTRREGADFPTPRARPGGSSRAAWDREVGEALLDQRVIAGIGNVIRNEACFRARVSPWRRVRDLEADEALRVVRESEVGHAPGACHGPAPQRHLQGFGAGDAPVRRRGARCWAGRCQLHRVLVCALPELDEAR